MHRVSARADVCKCVRVLLPMGSLLFMSCRLDAADQRGDVSGHPPTMAQHRCSQSASVVDPLAHHPAAHARGRPVPLASLALHRLSVSLTGAKHGAKPHATHLPVDMPTQYGSTCPWLLCYYVRIITVPTIRTDRPSKYAKLFVSSATPDRAWVQLGRAFLKFCCMASPGVSQGLT